MSTRTFHLDGTSPKNGEVFVFGSNLMGRHGAGAAKAAVNFFGARYGQAQGRQGQSYAIPTKDGRPGKAPLKSPLSTLPLAVIAEHVDAFIRYAQENPREQFFVTRVGCGLAGIKDSEMAPLFKKAPANCSFPNEWAAFLT